MVIKAKTRVNPRNNLENEIKPMRPVEHGQLEEEFTILLWLWEECFNFDFVDSQKLWWFAFVFIKYCGRVYQYFMYGLECGLSSEPACALLDCAALECPPSRGRVTDTSENESPLTILRLESRGLNRKI
ncbi:hypothetical protein CRG98_023855 [Punica granatum]|uniref:Uncharacterized protein n=1 Tax=Punica granatum TaxID=22663 RepID=A0A2I0JHP0_PUNGR|nr:hypothetical protein CRG98_023855 [Punica granatum]